MADGIKTQFDGGAAAPQKAFEVMVLGVGVMGKRRIASLLEVSEKVLAPQASGAECGQAAHPPY